MMQMWWEIPEPALEPVDYRVEYEDEELWDRAYEEDRDNDL